MLDPGDYAAVFIPGGHGTMFDFPDHPALGHLLRAGMAAAESSPGRRQLAFRLPPVLRQCAFDRLEAAAGVDAMRGWFRDVRGLPTDKEGDIPSAAIVELASKHFDTDIAPDLR